MLSTLRTFFSGRTLLVTVVLVSCLLLSTHPVSAAIINPVIGNLGNDAAAASSGATFAHYFVFLWRSGINIGAIVVLVYFAWGSIDWITSAGDKAKVESARNKITNAMIGIIILVSAFTLIGFFSNLVFGNDFNLLKLTFPTPDGSGGNGGGNGGGGNNTECGVQIKYGDYACWDTAPIPANCRYCDPVTKKFMPTSPDKNECAGKGLPCSGPNP